MSEGAPRIDPMPPHASGLPVVGAGFSLMRDPVGFFVRQRTRLGDTFVVDAFGYRLCAVFSPRGVAALYDAAEEDASFGLATYELVFKHKVPLEMLTGRRNRPHDLFGRDDVESYLDTLRHAVTLELTELGNRGRFEVFSLARRLGYRLGLSAWAGEEAASPQYLEDLIRHFDVLDASESFVRPLSVIFTKATGRRRELRAMRGIEGIFATILAERARTGLRRDDYLDQISDSFSDIEPEKRSVEVARDLMVIQMGAQSNLFAALGWTVVNVALRPHMVAAIRAGDTMILERCAHESIRLAQRSLTLRRVMRPFDLSIEGGTYRLSPGVFLATMLAVNNTSAAPGLEEFDPAHYEGRRLASTIDVAARELVSTFGHGRHSCPAQRFSISAIAVTLDALLQTFDIKPEFAAATPRIRQIGGVARAQQPCWIAYRRR